MSDEETIKAALARLRQLRNDRDYRRWKVEGGGPNHDNGRVVLADAHEEEIDLVAATVYDGEDAKAMVTLCAPDVHEAQIAILEHVLAHYSGDLGIGTNRHVVALAKAIVSSDA